MGSLRLVTACLALAAGCRFDLSGVPVQTEEPAAMGCDAKDIVVESQGVTCIGEYKGVTDTQIARGLCDASGSCVNSADIAGICSSDPVSKATSSAALCFLVHAQDEDVVELTRACTLYGEPDRPGLTMVLEGMSEACLSCYTEVVICAAEKCGVQCQANDAECTACYDASGCLEAFFACSGIKSVDEIKAASET